MEKEEPNRVTETGDEQKLSLSAALLAPLNSIFEAQIHSARAFLNFILQMGFRHKYTDKEKEDIKDRLSNLPKDSDAWQEANDILNEIARQEQAKADIQPLLEKAKTPQSVLTEDERLRIEDYAREFGDLYQQCIAYVDTTGKPRKIYIPNLALLPVQPLTIDNAKFNYEMFISDASKTFDQMGTVKTVTKDDRPWYLIKPRSVRGTITSDSMSEKSKTIKIEMNIKTGDMPYGLHQLLTALTNVAADTESKNPSTK